MRLSELREKWHQAAAIEHENDPAVALAYKRCAADLREALKHADEQGFRLTTERRQCKHVATPKLPSLLRRPTATIHLQSIVTSCEDEPCDIVYELCAACAGFYYEALRASEERGCVPVPIDRVNTTGLV